MTGRSPTPLRPRAAAAAGAVAIVIVATLSMASPAAAHTVSGVQPTNYRSDLDPIRPPIDGTTMRLLDLGRRVRLTNTGTLDVVVTGYSGEPYLRVGPRGVYENVRSPSVYINVATAGPTTTTTLPPEADATAAPKWRKVSAGRSVTWRDQRTRWEGTQPAAVQADPSSLHVVRTWTIFLQQGTSTSAAVARISWVPPPSATPWLVMAGLLGAATAGVVFTRRWREGLAAALALLVANDVVHSFAAAAASGDPLSTQLLRVLVGGFYGTIAWVVGAISVRAVQAGDDNGILLAGIVGFFIALLGGASDSAGLGRSQLIFALPTSVARAEVVVSLGAGVGLAAAAAWLLLGPRRRSQAATARPTPVRKKA